jgi:hypothetical protein
MTWQVMPWQTPANEPSWTSGAGSDAGQTNAADGIRQAGRIRTDSSDGGKSTRTVIGEMGFFRQVTRSATVSADGESTLLTLTRPSFERMRQERPDLAGAFHEFLLRTLADRIVLSDGMLLAIVH